MPARHPLLSQRGDAAAKSAEEELGMRAAEQAFGAERPRTIDTETRIG